MNGIITTYSTNKARNTSFAPSVEACTPTTRSMTAWAGKPSTLIAEASVELARAIALPAGELDRIRTASLLHDLGKLAIPDEILSKPGDLAESEWRDERDHDLGHGADEPLEVEHVEARDAVLADVAALLVAADLLVAARAEGELAVMLRVGAAEQHDADGAIVAGVGEGLEQLGYRVGREGVAPRGAVDRHARDAFRLLVDDVGEVPAFLPANLGLHGIKLDFPGRFSNE